MGVWQESLLDAFSKLVLLRCGDSALELENILLSFFSDHTL